MQMDKKLGSFESLPMIIGVVFLVKTLLHLFPQITISIQEYKWVTLDRQGGEGG